MGFKELFIKEETSSPQPLPVAQEVAPSTESVMPSVPREAGTVDKDIEAKIWDMIVAKNLPGPDYLEFKNAAAGLVDITPNVKLGYSGGSFIIRWIYTKFIKK